MPAPKIKAIDGIYDLRRTFGAVVREGFFGNFNKANVYPRSGNGPFYVTIESSMGYLESIKYKHMRDANRLLGVVIDEVRSTQKS